MKRSLLLLLCVCSTSTVWGQTSFPMVTHMHPVAVQRGKTVEVLVEGQMNFFGAYKFLFDAPGFKREIIPIPTPPPVPPAPPIIKSCKVKITPEENAPLGVREFRVASSLGISSIGQFVVVNDPVVLENLKNNTLTDSQVIQLPCVVAGKLEILEDVDYYKFEAKEGENLTFELFCARLQDKIHDLQKHAKPMLVLYDDQGRELAANDTFFFADPLLSYFIPKTGTYYVQVRESTYDGDPRWVYALVATNRPQVTHLFPMAGNPGKKIEVEPIGTAKKIQGKVELTAPLSLGVHSIQVDLKGGKSNPVTFVVSDLPQIIEQEPNDDPKQATAITLPVGINGRIEKKRDMDHYTFKATKGQALKFDLRARRFGTLLNSSLHGVLDVLDHKGNVLATNDITHGLEASLPFTANVDGEYWLRVRDLNSKGGETFVYSIEANFVIPDFTLRCDPDKAMIGPGSSAAWYVHVNRINGFTGPVEVEIKGLPASVQATKLIIPEKMTQGLIVVTADPKAELDAVNVEVVGKAVWKDKELVRKSMPNQEIYSPGGGRAKFDVNLQTVAITNPSDILKIEVSTTQINLKPGEETKIDVIIHRRADYDKGVSLDVMLEHLGSVFGNPLPPGVTVVPGKSKTLVGTGSKGHIVLKAAPNAEPLENVPISVVANVSINFVVKVAYSSPVILISVKAK